MMQIPLWPFAKVEEDVKKRQKRVLGAGVLACVLAVGGDKGAEVAADTYVQHHYPTMEAGMREKITNGIGTLFFLLAGSLGGLNLLRVSYKMLKEQQADSK
ncbi:MAG TPA: hypothetical protein V6C52_09740 [Coleofasciculaceae cyanobacterium]|jgi:hypothetical protein